ncbi:hypothetical protein RclHR1_00100008 [Rhizophagus clarus]|uniref:Uncharacterized protein n=1 Tax=Rhizophagus clarus TaxID=94130 RepID=A0A2Z6QEC6_9GLOM|nr:hypothetical protein RclHR1_00100008 [Rhizophagus clarus]GES75676.1 hypothetical protein RCL_jg12811.t1 [Rhizophagus clarus]
MVTFPVLYCNVPSSYFSSSHFSSSPVTGNIPSSSVSTPSISSNIPLQAGQSYTQRLSSSIQGLIPSAASNSATRANEKVNPQNRTVFEPALAGAIVEYKNSIYYHCHADGLCV